VKLYLQGILFTRASNYATRRGYADDKERMAIVDGWLAGYRSGKKLDPRVDKLLTEGESKENVNVEILPATFGHRFTPKGD
jgi:hypothetical protein